MNGEWTNMLKKATQAAQAKRTLAGLDGKTKNKALDAIIQALIENSQAIVSANQTDLKNAEKENLPTPLLKRLKFDRGKIDTACDGLASLIKLEDPVGHVLNWTVASSFTG